MKAVSLTANTPLFFSHGKYSTYTPKLQLTSSTLEKK